MKNLITLLFVSLYCLSYSQDSKKILLEWNNGNYSVTETNTVKIPYFQSESFIYNEVHKNIFYSNKFQVPFYIDENSLKINNIVFENISKEDLGDLSHILPNNINASIQNANARDVNYLLLTFSPIIKQDGIYKRVKSFQFDFSPSKENNIINNTNTISNSVLKTGDWFRFYVVKSGVYYVSKKFLSDLGFNVNIDPRTVKIFGNGGRMLPLKNSIPYPNDLTENAIHFEGENDGVFNDNDYILFYAEGPDEFNSESNTHVNLFTDKSYYYITSSAPIGKRINQFTEPSSTPNIVYNNYDDYKFYEVDKSNLIRLGRKWLGESFNIVSNQNFDFSFPTIDNSSPLSIKLQTAAAGTVSTSFSVKINNQSVGEINFPAIGVWGPVYAVENTLNATFNNPNSQITVNLNYNNNGVPNAVGYLDFISLKAKSFLKGHGKQFNFTIDNIANSIGTCEYRFTNASSISKIWDITDIYNVSSKENNGASLLSFKATMGEVKKYVAVDKEDYYLPLKEENSRVSNQDIKGTIFLNDQGEFKDIDYIIVTPSYLSSQAERLANFHKTNSNLNVKVVHLDEIYQEFSSGKQDIAAIRNLVKYVYENASEPSKRIKYLCLFGDGSFDFKDRIEKNTNIVPLFQSLYSFSKSSSFASDDFFGLMDSNEGDMNSALGLDIAVGRMLFTSLEQAEKMVTKVIDYHDEKSYGRWRNNITFISDDLDKTSDSTLQTDLNTLSDKITQEKPFFNSKKIHLDAYLQETTSGGEKYPKAKEDFINSFGQGSLVTNYFGHGGEEGLAGERIFESKDAIKLSNQYKYPLMVTVTCEFTRFDNPFKTTAGELTYGNPNGGAISMVTTTREIGQSTGQIFNIKFASYLFSYGSNDYTSIAEAVRKTKASSSSSGNNVVFYIGDPALKLAIPKPKINLTKINGIPTSNNPDALKGLSYTTLTGEITDEFNNLLSNYNGELGVVIYDKEIDRVTLGNDQTLIGGTLSLMNFKTLGETIFRGNATITNGKFEFGFVVPRDIKIAEGNGKVSFYAKTNNPKGDQTGFDFSIKIGGINENAVADNEPPKIRLYMNDESFVSGGNTNQSPLFLAFLEDENGINTASGIGHDIIAYLDGDETNPYLLNDFYETELNNYKKGKLKFPFRDLTPGLHTLTFKAWDVYNNLVTADLQFVVVGDETLTLSNVLNYPNPFVNHTEFWFTHNKPSEPLDVQVQVMTITGKVIWTKNQTITNNGFTSRDITWDGRDDFGDKIAKGVYVYKLTVKSNITNKKTEKYEKLVIL